ncbi:LysR family transcriptional regulator [Tahibacter amnicola]|uniref:LysR substrate-binding domain-containing protein n=1 Tax=Tahibacter amnicola TaxID=2976241 RepID=A0ABY6BFK0_9GAMM|nr:LysR family transcriptional regulator [Tahibacter amnicola]UXI68567.1 LysR substrate-binding domain-containing protein [Tahibacter amnicola]
MNRDLNDTLIFVKVVEQGGFTAAAKALGLPKTTVSRKVNELEQRLGARLLQRTTRRIGLTEAGALYYEHSRRIARELDEAEAAVNQLQGAPRGWLRVTAPHTLAVNALSPILPEFMARYPEVRVELILSNDVLDLVGAEIDVALRVGNLGDSSLSARRLGSFSGQVYASPDYIARHGEPLTPHELLHHRALVMSQYRSGTRYCWPLRSDTEDGEFPVTPILLSNDSSLFLSPLAAGSGLALLSDALVAPLLASRCVRRVLTQWRNPGHELNAVFPAGRSQLPKVRVFVDFLLERLRLGEWYLACSKSRDGEPHTETLA